MPLAISDYEHVLDWMEALIAAGDRAYVTAAAVNLVMSAQEDAATREAVLGATLAVPDGQPLVWALRALGHAHATRVYGPDLMAAFCARASRSGTPMYLYGGRSLQASVERRQFHVPARQGRCLAIVRRICGRRVVCSSW